MNFFQILEAEKNNPELVSKIDINELLRASENVDMNYFMNKSLEIISNEIVEVLRENNIPNKNIAEFCDKLCDFRFIDQIYQIHKGKHVRWIRLPKTGGQNKGLTNGGQNIVLTNGGIVVDIKFLDSGTHILCKNKNRFIQYKFDDCLTFQRLSDDEILVLSCVNKIDLLR